MESILNIILKVQLIVSKLTNTMQLIAIKTLNLWPALRVIQNSRLYSSHVHGQVYSVSIHLGTLSASSLHVSYTHLIITINTWVLITNRLWQAHVRVTFHQHYHILLLVIYLESILIVRHPHIDCISYINGWSCIDRAGHFKNVLSSWFYCTNYIHII